MDRFEAIRLYLRVVELGSFSKASGEIGIGQPAATKRVAALESALGARLLHRSTQGVTPTAIGIAYYEKCRQIIHHLEEAESVATLEQSQLGGELRISTSVAFGRRVLAPLLLEFMRENAGFRIDLQFEDRQIDLIEQGVDLALRMGRLADSTLGARWLGINPWVLVAAPAYLKGRRRPATPADLAEHEALIYSTVQGDARWHFEGRDGGKGGENDAGNDAVSLAIGVKGPLRSNSLTALLEACCAGFGIAALPRYVAREALQSGAVVALLEVWRLPAQALHAVFPSPRMVPARVVRLVDWLQPRFDEHWWDRNCGR